MKYKIITFLLFSLIFMLIIPSYSDTAMLQYNRNEYYETCEVAYNMEDMFNSTHLYDFALNSLHEEKDAGLNFVNGYFGLALENWDTVNNVTIPDLNIVDEDYTFMFWIFPTTSTSDGIFFEDTDNMIYKYSDNHIRFFGGLDGVFSINALPLNQWTHVACVRESSNTTHKARIYFNGTLDSGEKSTWRHRDWDGCIWIGNIAYGAMDGKLDEIRIYKGEARTQTEIQQDINTPMAMKLTIEGLEANEDVTQLWYPNMTLFEQKTADSEGKVEYNVYSFSNKTSEYQGIVNVYHEDIQYEGYVMVIYWGDVYRFTMIGLFADLFTQLFFGTGAWLGILVLILGSLLGLKFYKYTALIFSVFFVLLGLQYYQLFNSGVSDFMWFFVFCWVMPIFLIFAMFKMRR